MKADVSDAAGNPATEATQTLTVDEHAPTIAIDSNLAAGDNTVNISEAAAGFAITGTTTGAESGQTVTVHIVDGSNAVVDSYTTTAGSGTWSVNVTAAQAQALADGSYTVKADVSDAAGNPATEATQTLTVDEHAPTIAIDSNLAAATTPSTSARPRPALPSPAPPRVRRAARPSRSILSTARTPLLIATPPRPAAAPGRSTSRRHRRRRWPTAAIR